MDEPDPDQRAEPRHPIELKVEYKRLNSFLADYTRNISRGGTFIKTGRPLPVGTEFVFKLFVPHLGRPLAIHGEVQRVVTEAEADERRIDPGMGIRFVYREGDSQEVIAQAVEKLMIDSLGERLYRKLLEHSPAGEVGASPPSGGGPGTDDGKGGTS
ncbi:MAG: TIGR02266 family protein [Kofleriaceae bacterium]|nr:TIGR02266 family protein [Kofleriaceae bacterium]